CARAGGGFFDYW
nr:immunoglobulin heavy chain junction region [Macaca mulatta]MOY23063.1 immunoglobulin heavy chain junction region [Macaca mulatta]MOY23405.1 immunoglobulin heavy chain junction region [Macaca mulatta]MOY24284.1 immunoglobulin heavy chain junction region [Macaca mulatta]MOY24560.1 immunoglobulin heavy chain junction region [Macaca mulatta]